MALNCSGQNQIALSKNCFFGKIFLTTYSANKNDGVKCNGNFLFDEQF